MSKDDLFFFLFRLLPRLSRTLGGDVEEDQDYCDKAENVEQELE